MEKKLTKFIVKDYPKRELILSGMYEEISKMLDVDIKLIQNCGERAFQRWENVESNEIMNIFEMKSKQQVRAIEKIYRYFSENIDPFMIWKLNSQKTMTLASNALRNVFLIK